MYFKHNNSIFSLIYSKEHSGVYINIVDVRTKISSQIFDDNDTLFQHQAVLIYHQQFKPDIDLKFNNIDVTYINNNLMCVCDHTNESRVYFEIPKGVQNGWIRPPHQLK